MLKNKDLLSDEMKEDLSELSNLYHNMLNVYKDPINHAMDCYNGFVSTECLVIKNNLFAKRSEILNNARLNQLLNYLKNNQFLANLLINNNINDFTNCLISPITNNDRLLYMLNCNGQITGSFDNSSIKIIRNPNNTITIKEIPYSYKFNRFQYVFEQPLVASKYYPNSYIGKTNISINSVERQVQKNFSLVNTDILIQ